MRKSEIFESFVKIAQEKGLLSESEHAEHTEKDFPETNPRHDSLSIEQIGKLYGVKPDAPKDMEYKRNIIEDAHPEPYVSAPSYDKLNGLVENENEGQNIRLRIVMKDPDGHLVNRKYARKELLLSLVRVANELDNNGKDELRKLADVCLMQASQKKIKKNAFPWVIAGIVAAVGVIYAKQHLRFHTDGWTADYQKTTGEIDDLLNAAGSIQNTLEAGYTYTPQFLQTVEQLKVVLGQVDAAVQKVAPALDQVETPKTKSGITQEMSRIAQQPATATAAEAVKNLRTVLEENLPFLRKVIADFSSETYKQRAIAQKGMLSSMVDATEFLHGGRGLIADDFDDVAHALMALRADLANIIKELKGAENITKKFKDELDASQQDLDLTFNPPAEKQQTPATPSAAPGEGTAKNPADSWEEKAKALFGFGG